MFKMASARSHPIAIALPPSHRALAWIALGVGLVVLGLRWCVLHRFGYEVPYWPEWRGAGMLLFKPWAEDRFTWDHLFSLHNEHRHVLPRMWSLAFFAANGRWDPLLVQTANTVVSALNAGMLLWLAGRSIFTRHARWPLLAAGIALVAPFDYADLLVSYPAEFFFYITLTIVAIACWTMEHLTVGRLLGGACCAILASLTVAAGPLVAVVLLVCMMWRHRTLPSTVRFVAYLLAAAVLVVSWFLAPRGEIAAGAQPSLVAASAARYAAWPASNLIGLLAEWPDSSRYLPAFVAQFPNAESPWIGTVGAFLAGHRPVEIGCTWLVGLLLQAPCLLLLWRAARAGPERSPRFIVTLAVWVLLNLAAMALVRTELDQGRLLPPRFQDILALGLLVNVCALAEWWREPVSASAACWRRWISGVFLTVLVGSVSVTAAGIFAVQLPRKRAENRAATVLIQEYLRTGDARLFLNQPVNHVPWPGGENQLPDVLSDPTVRTFLPVSLYPPESRPSYPLLSRLCRHALALGWIPLLCGFGSVAWGVIRWRRNAMEPGAALN